MHADSRPGNAETADNGERPDTVALARAEINFAAAKELCRTGHVQADGTPCSYGGLAAANGYWLAFEGCQRSHGELCDLRAVCDGAPAETGFHGREGAVLVDDWIWRVTACQPCADLYITAHPEWVRKPPAEPVSHEELMRLLHEAADEQLAAMTPQQRSYSDMLTNLLLYGQHPAPETPPTYAGFLDLDDPVTYPRPATNRQPRSANATRRLGGRSGHLHDPPLISPPEPAGWAGYQPTSWMVIEDEAADFFASPYTLTDDPQQALTRAEAVVAALMCTNALLATCFAGRNALDTRIRFLRQMEELTTSRGVSQRDLDRAKSGLLALAEGAGARHPEANGAAANPSTHTFTSSPRKNGKSETLRRARPEHGGAKGAP